MADTSSFSRFVPGFEFLENLVKNAGSALPSMGQWVVPTLDPDELDRRIKDLRTVQFWLDQNSRMLATTIQALEVQRMTLSTLKGMNVTVNEMHEALKVRPAASPSAAPASPPAAPTAAKAAQAEGAAPAAVVDAMQWWGALTQQFTQLASQAMQAAGEVAAPAAPGAKAASRPAKGEGAEAGSKAAAAKRTSARQAPTAGNPAGRKSR